MAAFDYGILLERELPRPAAGAPGPLAIDLFAGCGGLALGFKAAGFATVGHEMDADACRSFGDNLQAECRRVVLGRDTAWETAAAVVVGGPPCQPFSVSGLQAGEGDLRNGLPAFLAAVERVRPKVALLENVPGMLGRNRVCLDGLVGRLRSLGYRVDWQVLNAADFGVPQSRKRLFVVAHHGGFAFPMPAAGTACTAGAALGDLAASVPADAKFLTGAMDEYVARYEAKSKCVRPRDLHLDRPSRTVTCRNLNGATGDMLRLRLPDGRRRRLTVREAARLQSFPDWFAFAGGEGSQFNQIGNAVPPLLAKAVAVAVRDALELPAPRQPTGAKSGTTSLMSSTKSSSA